MEGHEVEQLVELSLDGELDREDEAELRRRLDSDPEQSKTYHRERRFKDNLQKRLRDATVDCPTPSHLRAAVSERIEVEEVRVRGLGWGRSVAASLAVAGLVVISWVTVQEEFDPEGLVSVHSTNPPPDVRPRGNPTTVKAFFRNRLGFDVPVPRLERSIPNLRLVGARLAHIKDREAAYLMYEKRGARISVFAFPKPGGLRQPEHFVPDDVDGRRILTGRHRGYNVSYFQDGEMVYSVVGDVEPVEIQRLVAGF